MRAMIRRLGTVLPALLWAAAVQAGPLTDEGTQPILNYPLLAPSDCAGCHGDFAESDHEPGPSWAGSMMAQASRDPLFWAALDVANNDLPGAGEFCLRCHVPVGWLAGRSEPDVDGCGLEGLLDQPNADFDGVTCHVCHRMMVEPAPPPGQQGVYFENAQYWIDDGDCDGAGEPCRRGPYDYPLPPEAPHAWAASPYHESSDVCGNCHNVTNPVKNLIVGGVDSGVPMPIERTYDEWSQSAYAAPGPGAATCQNCHMPDWTEAPAYASSWELYDRAGDLPVHRFAGGNAWIPDVLRQEYPGLNLDAELTATRDHALDMLQNQSAAVELIVPPFAVAGTDLDVQVKVTNLTGHKLPTGYPEGRRMWLQLSARLGLVGPVIWQSGAYDGASGVLTHDPQIKVYRVEPGIWNHNGTGECDSHDGLANPLFHFVLNDCVVIDNRIPPLGFNGGSDIETRPVGYVYPETAPGSGVLVNHDVTSYAIPIPPGTTQNVRVTATLRYQTASKEYVDFLLAEATTHGFPDDCLARSSGLPGASRAEILHGMWSSNGRSPPVDMGSATSALPTLAPTPGEASGAGSMLAVGHGPGGDVEIAFDPACGATDHAVYFGSLDDVATPGYAGKACGLGTLGSAVFDPGAGDAFWIVVGQDGVNEGSYGLDGDGLERAEDTALPGCNLPQDLARRCD